ncbi:TonB-dependent receptor [uncultured Muribaculum sp.]|uniref:TonB-dependent receptor plug domain-containing protein n=3 Tax=uncultured Muribaculum sp. TaxID=1918613 RepID=UPI00258CF8A3|nr:TonB-dependent receptor [uncultured Muribaculum sp.]
MTTKRLLVFVAIITVTIISIPAYGSAPDSSAVPIQQIKNITVVGKPSSKSLTSAVPQQTLTADQISRLGITDMGDAVRRFSGANVKDYGGIGGLKTVSVRNMGAAHTAVSYDGVSVGNTQAGQIDIGRFPLDNVAMMSLVVGQSDNLLQSARLFASGSVLNITTMRPYFKNGRKHHLVTKLATGSFGLANASVRVWQKLSESTSFSTDASYLRADGNYPFKLHNGSIITNEHRNNSAIESHRIELGLYHDFGSNATLDLKGLYYYSRRGLPGAVIYYNPRSTEKLWDQDAFLQANFHKTFSEKWRMQAQAKYSHSWNRHKGKGIEFTNGFFKETMRQDEYYVSATGLYAPTGNIQISLAQDIIANTLSTSFPECPYPRRISYITALNAKYEPAEFLLANAGGVLYITDEHVKYGKTPDNFRQLAPAASIRISPLPGQNLYTRFLYKGTFRLPSFNDMYYYRIGNTGLKPEKAREFNAGITYSPNYVTHWLESVIITADWYYNRVTDKIVAIPTTFAWKMQNYGKVHATGVDVNIQAVFKPLQWAELTLQGAYTWQKAIDVTSKNKKNYRHQLPYTPRNNGNVSITIKTPWITAGYSIVCVGKRYYLAQNLPENEIGAYQDHSLSIQHDFKLKPGLILNLKGDILNLTNKQYDVIKYYPMPGRNWRIAATLTF